MSTPTYATDRNEEDPCEAGTTGCSVSHAESPPDTSCETW